ncbi:hypothetical protein LSTR_LSTR004958 [Laodelphax striatellus]|uniref:Pickpocket n=1 Tax=Laodelphax striatellus TaxID=195883 RepID=A0A482XPC7_LAOST|nr:hypothetical protein LSTR_LSTR004958 [Laodelphax striatellus]
MAKNRAFKRKTFIKRHIEDYCEASTLHGVKYVVSRDRPLFERTWWMIAILCSFLWSLYLIQQVWEKWNNSPVIVSFAEKSTSVWQIPFPAVTICSENKARQTIYNYTKYHHMNDSELTDDLFEKREVISLICDQHINNGGELTINESKIEFLEEVASPFEEVLFVCKWKEQLKECTEFFTPIMTEEGYCFTSNSLNHFDFYHNDGLNSKYMESLPNATDWNLEEGYKDSSPVDTYPRRAIGSGKKSGLTILMMARKNDLDYLCRGAVQGFKVTMHNPAEIPRVAERFFRVPLNQEVVLAVKPNMMTTSSNLLSYSPKGRQCFFPHERKLLFFKVYTQRNCELECLTNYTLKSCGCVSYYMPRAKDTLICGSESKNCTGYAYEKMIDEEITVTLKNKGDTTCNCLQSCTSLEYEAETSQATFDWEKQMMAYEVNMSDPDLLDSTFSRLSIYYKDAQFITSHRSELYGLADFLAGCGGLLGLTSGFSILSLVEIIYYLTLRLCNNYSQEKERQNDTEIEKSEKCKV